MKKKMVVALILLAAGAAGCLYGLPYGKIYQILSALQGQDRERLVRYIDFPQLRLGIKEQIRAARSAPSRHGDLEKLEQAMTAQVLDQVVDQLVTPEGLVLFFNRNLAILLGTSGPEASPGAFDSAKIFLAFLGRAQCAYASSSAFMATLQDPEGKDRPVRFLLQRNGLDWRLIRIEVPLPAFGATKQGTGP